ncbi:hypothetical protein NXY11_22435 [Parabacteroides faecis]|uniref:hypothetical protein n=1 Tax=Parabacteroides faecis TaxID=1217282 RepID=UPI002164B04B|nr:hypothetical protein [Parabacteroides faecis]MCS2890431.1 hypothetical protein [Parabacteroides faecis]UVQ45883.1 hypothetical protein NXY11_22435 [Parabacteroides faecis]
MALFSIYTYQFFPISNTTEYDLFRDVLAERKKIMSEKNSIFENIVKQTTFIHRGKKLSAQFLFNKENIIVFKLANCKTIKLEKKFHKAIEINEPSSFIIIYNDPEIQRIAIEQNASAFSETEVVAKILRNSFASSLKPYELNIKIKKEYQEQEFWTLINQHTENIQMVRFEFDYPNLPRISECIGELIQNVSKNVCSNKTRFEFNSDENHSLHIDENDEQVKGLAKASSDSGNPIICKFKGYKKHFKTGHTTKIIELDEVDIQAQDIKDIKDIFETLRS